MAIQGIPISFSRLTDLRYRSRTSYWFVPTLMVAMAIGLAIGALRLDLLLASKLSDLMPWFGAMGAEAARKILTTTASTMVTVAGVVFSITIVALQLASSQFGPRLLRNFMSDRANQIVLGTFTSAFVYCLVVLAAVRDNPDGFVPVMAVWFGLFLGVAGIGVLIFFDPPHCSVDQGRECRCERRGRTRCGGRPLVSAGDWRGTGRG